MAERVNCSILEPSDLARRDSILTCQKRLPSSDKGRKHASPHLVKVSKSVDASFAVNVSRKWHSAKNKLASIFGVYKWLDAAPLGLFIDVWA